MKGQLGLTFADALERAEQNERKINLIKKALSMPVSDVEQLRRELLKIIEGLR